MVTHTNSLSSLAWQDHLVLLVYLVGMLVCGLFATRRRRSQDEYFLGGRRIPWSVAGISVVASLLSSLSYLAEPGEVWKSGITHVAGKLVGIPLGLALVWFVCLPFMMQFRFTSAYEYLGRRFGVGCRRLGAALFVLMMVLWMGFVVQALSLVFHQATGLPLAWVVCSVGLVATVYTMFGGLRAVVWTDVVQVALLIAGAVITIIAIGQATQSGPADWLATAHRHLAATGQLEALPWFSWDPTTRATVVTVAINMAVWQFCMHTSNQVTVQRYFSTADARAARRSLVASGVVYVAINVLLVAVGLAVMHYYLAFGIPIDGDLDPETKRDLIFPMFAVQRLAPGLAGAILAALMAAAMSSVDSGANSIATVVALEFQADAPRRDGSVPERSNVDLAMLLTLAAGLAITLAAFGLCYLPSRWGIVAAIPRTFNAITGPLGGLFVLGMFVPQSRSFTAIVATLAGLAASIAMGYLQQIGDLLVRGGICAERLPELSFTWIQPASLFVTVATGIVLACVDRAFFASAAHPVPKGLTWFTRA